MTGQQKTGEGPRATVSEPARKLLSWYEENRRELPWRADRDPYRIWVSEIMLQQTRVETVVPYYERFIERYPTPAVLAGADEEEVVALWSGLGYYSRARRLLAASRLVADRGLPETAAELQRLPGIGPYTAAAIASIAYGEVVPVLDGNTTRVASRLLASQEDTSRTETRRRLSRKLEPLLDERRPGDSNQALMELGATVCTPRNPDCGACPLDDGCRASSSTEPESFPAARKKRAVTRIRGVVVLVKKGERTLLVRRREESRFLAGIWELPWAESSTLEEAELGLGRRYGGGWSIGARLGEIRHSITHRRIELEVRTAELEEDGLVAERGEANWFTEEELDTIPLTSLVRKAWLEAHAGSLPEI